MAENEVTTTINRPAEEVFNLISNIPDYSKWVADISPFFIDTKVMPDGPVGLGTTFEDRLKFGKNVGTVVEFQPSKKFVVEQKWYPESHIWKMRIEYEFDPVNGSTRITSKADLMPIGGFEVLKEPMSEMALQERLRTLEGAKKVLEK